MFLFLVLMLVGMGDGREDYGYAFQHCIAFMGFTYMGPVYMTGVLIVFAFFLSLSFSIIGTSLLYECMFFFCTLVYSLRTKGCFAWLFPFVFVHVYIYIYIFYLHVVGLVVGWVGGKT